MGKFVEPNAANPAFGTSLYPVCLQERPSLVGPLLRIPDGRVSLAEGERLLREHNRLPDFLQLLRARGQHSKALALLHQHQHTTQPSPLKGPWVLVDYLQNLGVEHTEVILSNSAWLVKHHPMEALRVFTGVGAPVTDAEQLSRVRVAEFIKPLQPRLCLLYLEHVVQEWKDKTNTLHNELVKLYRDIIIEEDARQQHGQSRADHDITGYIFDMSISSPEDNPLDTTKEANDPDIYDSEQDLLNQDEDANLNDSTSKEACAEDTNANNATFTPIEEIPPELRFNLANLQERLLKFLQDSTYYSPTTALLNLPQEYGEFRPHFLTAVLL
ncbi:Vacuolar sorting protein 39/Transforming growth factor beta receptor-associated domain 1 [Trinorchestia longiramus]|nr:Vacuolar sorting protein 39/Transforming growth factor beta receptor-associated domain 1 [Trinorchestia longiramus]